VGTKQIGVRLAVAGRGRGAWIFISILKPLGEPAIRNAGSRVAVVSEATKFDGEVLIYNDIVIAYEHKLKVINGLCSFC
jgi:hypothetical protein